MPEASGGSRPLLVSHGIALGCLVSTILGLPAYAERRLRLRNCSISRIDYQESRGWRRVGWWRWQGTFRILMPLRWMNCSVNDVSGSRIPYAD
jgi:broad specificity phosphatase PhoE